MLVHVKDRFFNHQLPQFNTLLTALAAEWLPLSADYTPCP